MLVRTFVGIISLGLVVSFLGMVLAEGEVDSIQEINEIIIPQKPTSGLRSVFVERVIDGDTIITNEEERIRYIGMNTPETVHPSKPVEFFGQEASDKNKELVKGKTVELEFDIQQIDQYGRTLACIWLDSVMINAELVAEGYAQVSTIPPNVKYADYFVALQEEARTGGKGLWAAQNEASVVDESNETIEVQDVEQTRSNLSWLWWAGSIGLVSLLLYKWIRR